MTSHWALPIKCPVRGTVPPGVIEISFTYAKKLPTVVPLLNVNSNGILGILMNTPPSDAVNTVPVSEATYSVVSPPVMPVGAVKVTLRVNELPV